MRRKCEIVSYEKKKVDTEESQSLELGSEDEESGLYGVNDS